MSTRNLKHHLSAKTLTALGAIALSGTAFAAGGGGADPLAQYAEEGPYATTSESDGFSCTVYRPTDVPDNAPIIVWGNGTGATPDVYGDGLEHWASWGYVVTAADTSNPGEGDEMIDCLDRLENADYAASLDFSSVGTSGHSQGGGGSIMAGRDDRVTATAPMQPYTIGLGHDSSSQRQQNGPMLLLSGESDNIAGATLNQDPVFRRANVPVFYATLDGADHFEPTGDFGDFAGISTAWWEYKLKGEQEPADLFNNNCEICDLSDWEVEQEGNL